MRAAVEGGPVGDRGGHATNAGTTFSDELERWLASDIPKSLGSLGDVFEEKTFAVAIVLLMLVSATPIPTGGITFIFQVNAAAIAGRLCSNERSFSDSPA